MKVLNRIKTTALTFDDYSDELTEITEHNFASLLKELPFDLQDSAVFDLNLISYHCFKGNHTKFNFKVGMPDCALQCYFDGKKLSTKISIISKTFKDSRDARYFADVLQVLSDIKESDLQKALLKNIDDFKSFLSDKE